MPSISLIYQSYKQSSIHVEFGISRGGGEGEEG